ncbi:MAG: response regulator transcription factor [Lachnospiraceae bacterium]|nr:response regulator transcription factor [Lachnospiraceae bacterium]
MSENKILIIEDDTDIREGVKLILTSEGYTVDEAENGLIGLEKIDDRTDLVILDVMMPGISGIQTCKKIREFSNVPVLFLTAKSGESDKLMGLMAGGDDYLPKPFSYAELLGRVKALLRRYKVYQGKAETGDDGAILESGEIRLDTSSMEVTVNGKAVELTDLEYRILTLFLSYPKKVFSAQNLYESVWQEPYLYTSNGTVMVHIRNLRTKIEKNPEDPVHIKTVWGKGYRFE